MTNSIFQPTSEKRIQIDYSLIDADQCPVCGESMKKWREKLPDGTEKCPPACPNCGHALPLEKHQRMNEGDRITNSLRMSAIKKMKTNSIIQDPSIWKCLFENFDLLDEPTRIAAEKAEYWAKEVLRGQPLHAVIAGKPGVGKTHLSMAMVNYISSKDYKTSCIFVSYQKLYEDLKFCMSDPQAQKMLQGTIMKEIKHCDFAVIDDLGAELGRMEDNNQATSYNTGIISALAEARAEKATVYTTNLSSKQIKFAYGERAYSRIMNGAAKNIINLQNTADKRMR